jgi:predicted ArsR family transcriptional regulator
MRGTRQEILDYLQRNGRATVRQLGELLGLTSTGVRQHLAVLEREGLVAAREERGRVGRPALVYSLTDRASQLYPKRYDALATAVLDEIKARTGPAGFLAILKGASSRMAQPFLDRVEGKEHEERVHETAAIMQELGLLVELEEGPGGEHLLHECTCPYPKVAPRHPAVCALEVDMVSRLTGGDARLVTSLLRGDRACTYRIRADPAETR